MQIQLTDLMTVDRGSVRETRDGYLVVNARAARTGVQEYRARELGLTDRKPDDIIRVYRPPSEVFHADALASMAYRPMTNDHPAASVNSTNWKDHSVGQSGGEIARDGDFVRVPMVMMDAVAISDFKAGKRELSVGYTCDLVMDSGVVPAGERDAGMAFDAYQTTIRANHHALCWQARGGDELIFGDGAAPPQPQETPKMSTIQMTVDGIPLTVDATTQAILTKLTGERQTALDAVQAAQTRLGELTAAVAAKDGEIAGLNSKLADATNPATLAAAAAARASVIGKARSLLGDAFTGDGKSDAEIRRAAVAVKLPDAADPAKMVDAAVEGAFNALTQGVKTTTASDGVAAVVANGVQSADGQDPKALRDAALAARASGKAQAYLPDAAA